MLGEVYISLDIESDGPTPGDFSMLSLGAVAFDQNGQELSDFKRNLFPLDGARQHPDTMAWWATQPTAWLGATEDAMDPGEAMRQFHAWVKHYNEPVAVCYPATYDFMFVYWYLVHFCGDSPFSFSALDLKTYAMATLKTPFRKTVKKVMPRAWFGGGAHTHDALEDAREQGRLFFKMRSANAGR